MKMLLALYSTSLHILPANISYNTYCVDNSWSFLLFQPEELEYLSINLRLDAFIIKDSLSLRWTSEAGMVENMESIVEEYKDTRQLLVSVIQIKEFYWHNSLLAHNWYKSFHWFVIYR